MGQIKRTFGGQIQILHGYPLSNVDIEDQVTIRGLLEIEAWLTSIDTRRLHSLGKTSIYFCNQLSASDGTTNKACELSIPLRMPASLHTRDRIPFVGLGWHNIAPKLKATTPEQEASFLKVMLQELNLEFALQLDTDPSTDRLLYTHEADRRPLMILGGGSHARRLAEAVGHINPEVIDLTIGGWKISTENVQNLTSDIEEALGNAENIEDCTVILVLFDNSIYKGGSIASPSEPTKIDGRFHIVGDLHLVSEAEFKVLFEAILPVLRAARGSKIMLVGPLARYAIHSCCNDPTHVTNSDDPGFVTGIKDQLLSLGKALKNLVHVRRIKNAKVLNPAVLMGLANASPDSMMKIWGPDPVHPTREAYNTMAVKIMDEIDSEVVLNARLPSSGPATPGPSGGAGKPGPNSVRPREEWTHGSQTVADRFDYRSGHNMRGGPLRGGRRGSRGRGHPYRGRAGRRY